MRRQKPQRRQERQEPQEQRDFLAVADWRRRVAALYADVRAAAASDAPAAAGRFRAGRDELFHHHPATPLTGAARERFSGLPYFPYEPAWRLCGALDSSVEQRETALELGDDGAASLRRFARVHFTVGEASAALDVFWIGEYGGGIFLPFADATSGNQTFGGGRYLYDTIKGADLGGGDQSLILDFNYAYNPSCAYDAVWVCPLAPPQNRLPFAVPVGERI